MKDQVVMITGGAKGIGRAFAEAFLEAGAHISLTSRTETELSSAFHDLSKKYPKRVFTQVADISKAEEVSLWFQETQNHLGRPSVLINNAGIFINKTITEQTLEDWEKVVRVNLTGTFLCSQAFFKICSQTNGPKAIVNISSLAGIRGTEKFPGLSSYVASKFGVVGLTEALAVEGKAIGIRVNCIAPGAVATQMLKKALPHLSPKAQPQDIAKIALFLCDERQSGVLTGSTIEVFSNA